MWGSWYGILFGGLLVVLLIVGVAFGTSALLFPLVIAAVIVGVVAVLYVLGAVGQRADTTPDPVADAAPAHGEGSEPAQT
jgi:hypothetical protein